MGRPRLRRVRRDEVKVGAEYLLESWTDRAFEVLGPLYEDADGGHYTRKHPGTHVKRGWWVVRGPNGPMRVQTRELRLRADAPAPPPAPTEEHR